MRVGILALQGAVQEHERAFHRLGAETREVRRPAELAGLGALVLPGGESTVMARFLADYGLVEPIRAAVAGGLAVWGLCAGAILLCEEVDGRPGALRILPAAARRNAYGRHQSSFEEELATPVGSFRGIFIRAPRLEPLAGTEILARRRKATAGPTDSGGGEAVLLRAGRVLAASFHPELAADDRLHDYFLHIATR